MAPSQKYVALELKRFQSGCTLPPPIRPKTGRMGATCQRGDGMTVDQFKVARCLEIDISVRSVMGPAVYSGLSNAMKLS
jgi:hypothetical protein